MRKISCIALALAVCMAISPAFSADYWNDDAYKLIEETVTANCPKFPDKVITITDAKYAALVADMEEEYYVSDGKEGHERKTQTVKDYTPAIQAAIDDMSKAGGGMVVIPAGTYYTGSIELKSNVNLHLEEGTELRFVRNISNKYYPMVLTSFEGNDTYNYAAPIRAFHAKNIALSLPMPKRRGFLRSLILSFHLQKQVSLFSRAWPVRPYCIAPKGTQHYFDLLLTPFLIEPVTVHSVRRYLSLSAALRREASATPCCI